MLISVIGESKASPRNYSLAEEVGRLLAASGITTVCGGLGGVMEAVCKGARTAGGSTIGILPGLDPKEANDWIEYPVCTGLGYARNIVVARAGLVVIAIGGAYGTLSEIGHALSEGKPLVALNTWSFSRNKRNDTSMHVCNTAKEAVETAISLGQCSYAQG